MSTQTVVTKTLESTINERTGAHIFVDTLNDLGVKYIFGHTGGAVIPIYVELNKRIGRRERAPRYHIFGQEGGAGHAAEGYSETSGNIGVALATSGPGATNLTTSIADAYMDSRPVVFITGQVDKNALGKDAFQEVDTTGIMLPITKHSYLVTDTEDLEGTLREAFNLAKYGRPGPVVVDICKNALLNKSANGYNPSLKLRQRPEIKLDQNQAELLLEDLLKHERPVILAGAGCSYASPELYAFAKKHNIPVTLTLKGSGAIPHDDDLFLGMPGMHGTAAANYALRDADFILNIGSRFDDGVVVRDFGKGKTIAHIDLDESELNKVIPADHALHANAKDFLTYALSYDGRFANDLSGWHDTIEQWKSKFPLSYSNEGDAIKPQYVIETISQLTNGDATITTGVGQHQMWTAQFYNFTRPNQLITSGGLGTMGFGEPAAIGAYLGDPSKQVVCITGDGSFQMNQQELATIAKNDFPIKIFILNNGYLGMVRQWEDEFFEGQHGETCLTKKLDCNPACSYDGTECTGQNPDFVKLALAYSSFEALRITTKDEVIPRIKKALESKGPYVVDIWVDKLEDVKPMIRPGGSANDTIF